MVKTQVLVYKLLEVEVPFNPRSSYEHVSGNLFLCPTPLEGARHRVRFTYNEPMFNPDGTYHQPLILVLEAEPS